MARLKILFLTLATALLSVSCSKDYRSSIPAGCQALMTIDLISLGKDMNIADESRQSALKDLLMIDDISTCGIDVTEKLYGFETADGEFGVVAKVGSKSNLKDWFSGLTDKKVCKSLGEKRGYDFYLIKDAFLASYNGSTLMIMGPVVGGETSRKQVQMAKYLDAEDGEGIMQSKIFERINQLEGSVTLVARSSALPDKFVAPFTLGAPKGTDASEVLISAEMNINNGMLQVVGDVFSFNSSVDEALRQASASYRPIKGTHLDKIPATAQFAMAANVVGADYLKLLRTNEALRTMLLGINTAIDIDKMIASVDGDIIVAASEAQAERTAITLVATTTKNDWLDDVAYWKKSCPAGTTINNVGAADSHQFTMSGSSVNAAFGMSDTNTMYISSNPDIKSAADIAELQKQGMAADITSAMKGKRMCAVINLDGVTRQKQELSVVTNMLKPLFGDVHTLIYTLK